MGEGVRLEAAGGLAIEFDGTGGRVCWETHDWWGPAGLHLAAHPDTLRADRFVPFEGGDDLGHYKGSEVRWEPVPRAIRTLVRAYDRRSIVVFRTEVLEDVQDLATGTFAEPSVSWPCFRPAEREEGGVPEGTRSFGYQYTEFGLPTFSDPDFSTFFLLGHRPPAVQPLFLVAPDGRTMMLAPLDAFHEQVFSVPSGTDGGASTVRCGWHGDLDRLPRGFATEIALFAGPGPRELLDAWAELLLRRHATIRSSRYADEGIGRLSYWTDNGAAYWYRTEDGMKVPETLGRVADNLRDRDVPVRAFQLDSWFYPHQVLRPFDTDDWEVPPTGLVRWEPREDVLPDGIVDLRKRLGDPPLILHSRHFSAESPYFERYPSWLDGDRAHPSEPDLLDHLLEQAASWGAITYEQDWMVETFLGVRGLREEPGRARAWQESIDRAADAHGLTLQWCMATPADFMQTVTLRRLTSVRTSGDYRYIVGNGALWAWFLYTNALARSLGLWPFKDVFFSSPTGEGRDGDPHAEAEALLATLSAGPVGIGDRLGRTDRDVVMRTCRSDGVLVKPDVPIAALNRCFGGNVFTEGGPLIGEAHTDHAAGRWIYLASFNAWRKEQPIRFRIELADLGPDRPNGPVLAYDWRSGDFARLDPDGGFDLELTPLDWDYRVLCPILPENVAVVGDTSLYATAGDRRVRGVAVRDGQVEVDVVGAPGESVEITGWAARPPAAVVGWSSHGEEELSVSREARTGLWRVPLVLGSGGRLRLRIEV